MNIEELSDRELDALVAEKVMGWRFNEDVVWDTGDIKRRPGDAVMIDGLWEHLPFFSTDIAAAWEVVDQAKKLGVSFDIHEPAKGKRCVLAFFGDDSVRVVNPNPARAICLAALKAVGVKA